MMLNTCFLHLPGVGPAFADKLRAAGIFTWGDALSRPLPCGARRAADLRMGVEESLERLRLGDGKWFSVKLPPAQHWRLFPHFRDRAAYVDIETTGSWDWANEQGCCITTIALYDGRKVRTYVQGENLEAFADDILKYKLLVTWNGRGFDAPILRRALSIPLDLADDMAHLDLLPVFRGMGLRGGLKNVERQLGLDRGGLNGVDGWAAPRLWRIYRQTGKAAALETLLAYNVADVLSLECLAGYAAAWHEQGAEAARVPGVRNQCNPYAPDPSILRGLYW